MANSLTSIVIVGASSGIGAALALELAQPGRTLALVARRQAELERVAEQVRRKGAVARVETCDAADPAAVQGCWDRLQGASKSVDCLVYASGVILDVAPDEFDTAKDRAMIDVNVGGLVAWLNCAARDFSAAGRGTIAALGSVAGDRGRRAAPVYGATKAVLDTYLESLRNRLSVRGVSVVTIKPGPVNTPMLAGKKMPLTVEPQVAARAIARGLQRGAHTVYVHPLWRWIMLAIRCVPSPIFRRLAI
ncbi:MAG: SDR family NAD(P)-dependent oxidoreductase [Deltaproteobacteria bacterium]|nr:SDR family NAD(P)-dependent oxidoreductase [Deltaproteobacteria bacterium]